MTTADVFKYLRFYVRTTAVGQTATLEIDYVKYYGIANYTTTLTGTSSDDVLYVSSALYCSGTSFTSIVLDRDPALSVATATYNVWNVTTGSGTPQTDYYVAAWAGYSAETRSELASGTLTDVRIKFTASANIAAITFMDIRDWVLVSDSRLYFQVPMSDEMAWALNGWYMLFGMGLVIASGVYLVKGGRKEMSMDKGYIAVIAFFIGWALIIGGILP
jgi:hypothetical protein